MKKNKSSIFLTYMCPSANSIEELKIGDMIRISEDLDTCLINEIYEQDGIEYFTVVQVFHHYSSRGGLEFSHKAVDKSFSSLTILERWVGIDGFTHRDYGNLSAYLESLRQAIEENLPEQIDGDIVEFVRCMIDKKDEYYQPTFKSKLEEIVTNKIKEEYQYIFDYIDSQLKEG